VSSAFQ